MCAKNEKKQIAKLIDEYRNIEKRYRKNNKEILQKLAGENPTIEDHCVKSEVCFIFSCPGQEELLAGKVCAGQTGKNLDLLIKHLGKLCKKIFSEEDRYKYNLLNASKLVHFEALNGKTEDNEKNIIKKENVERIINILKRQKIKYVILCGKRAKLLEEEIKKIENIYIAEIGHLGLQGINQNIKQTIDGNEIMSLGQSDRTEARMEVIANNIWSQINNKTQKR